MRKGGQFDLEHFENRQNAQAGISIARFRQFQIAS